MTAITVSVEAHVELDEVYAALNREATQAKRAGDMNQAVALLYEAKAHKGDLYQETRLAKFLQQAGQLDEALEEIQWLLDKSAAWAKAMFGHQPASVRLQQQVIWKSQIEGAAVLICKRARRSDLQAVHQQRQDAYIALREKITPVSDADQAERHRAAEAKLARWMKRRGAGGNAT